MKIRPLRGQVVVREIPHEASAILWTPTNPRAVLVHRGRVLAMGPPAQTARGVDVPHGFSVGDEVLYSHQIHERSFARPWTDGEAASWVPQEAVSGVVEP
jgi:co-chaperonin GroES (HSP10)